MTNEELDTIIEESMKTINDFHLSEGFSKKVTLAAVSNGQWRSDLLEYFYLTIVIISLLSVAAGLYYYFDKIFVVRLLSIVSQEFPQFVLSVLLLNFILFADKVILPFLFNRWKRI